MPRPIVQQCTSHNGQSTSPNLRNNGSGLDPGGTPSVSTGYYYFWERNENFERKQHYRRRHTTYSRFEDQNWSWFNFIWKRIKIFRGKATKSNLPLWIWTLISRFEYSFPCYEYLSIFKRVYSASPLILSTWQCEEWLPSLLASLDWMSRCWSIPLFCI